MSNSAKKSPPNRLKTAQSASTASERKPALSIIKDILRQTRRQYTAEEKIRIVLVLHPVSNVGHRAYI